MTARSAGNQRIVDPGGGVVPPILQFAGVSKRYGTTTAVDRLDLSLSRGQVTAFLGENGAGKTTSISMALGLVRPTEGTVTIGGAPAGSLQARRRIGAMLQSAELPDQLTVAEHVRLFQTYYPAPMAFDRLVDLVGLAGMLGKRYGVLSGGQRRRVQLALALCGDGDLIVLDEPTVGLDVDARHMFWRVIRTLVSEDKSILLTTHYLEEADALADRVLVMSGGRIIADGTPSDIKALAGGKLIECRTDAPAHILADLPGVERVDYVGGHFRLTTSQAEETLRSLFATGHAVEDISVSRAGLEAAFMSITRSNNRAGEAA